MIQHLWLATHWRVASCFRTVPSRQQPPRPKETVFGHPSDKPQPQWAADPSQGAHMARTRHIFMRNQQNVWLKPMVVDRETYHTSLGPVQTFVLEISNVSPPAWVLLACCCLLARMRACPGSNQVMPGPFFPYYRSSLSKSLKPQPMPPLPPGGAPQALRRRAARGSGWVRP